ncbi:uncharacterized protein TrAFT101_009920, partial [Trichoderma asperellum]|uniref:uncharacterized protein n=1 Tax=Trichoderma asperellum TaxID=101201 RepID=UPI00332B6104
PIIHPLYVPVQQRLRGSSLLFRHAHEVFFSSASASAVSLSRLRSTDSFFLSVLCCSRAYPVGAGLSIPAYQSRITTSLLSPTTPQASCLLFVSHKTQDCVLAQAFPSLDSRHAILLNSTGCH